MNVFLTFDVEVWCNNWANLDGAFQGSFERYVYGSSPHGDYALPQTMAILNRYGLKGVFFVEPLFATRFGVEYLEIIVKLIRAAGHEIQLHLHPEWTNEAKVPIIQNSSTKRQHLCYYTLEEQTELIACGKKLMEAAGSGPVSAFRAGSFAANRDTFEALRRNGIFLDTSLSRSYDVSGPDLRSEYSFDVPFVLSDVSTYPVTVIKDGLRNDRPAEVTACSFREMRDALWDAQRAGLKEFVIVSHNFELLRRGSSEPDWIVAKRFEQLCAFLARHPEKFTVRGFGDDMELDPHDRRTATQPKANFGSTSWRYLEQAYRALIY